MTRRFIKIPMANSIRRGRKEIHHVWLDVSTITKVTYANDKDGDARPKIYYITADGEESWYSPNPGVISTEEIMAKIMGPELSIEDKEMLDGELALTLMQTQVLLQETWAEKQKMQEKVSATEAKYQKLLLDADEIWEGRRRLELARAGAEANRTRMSDLDATGWFALICVAGVFLLLLWVFL